MDHDGGHGGHGGGGGGGGDGDHGGHDGGDMTCSMNMLFNWSTENLCVVFESWRINTPFALVLSCLVIIALSASYELLRAQSRQFEERLIEGDRKRHEESRGAVSGDAAEDETPLLSPRPHVLRLSNQQQLTRALFYMAQVFVGFFLMLIFMTYNGYLMISTVLGAGIGFFYFGGNSLSTSTSTKALSCH
ncbi:solute carrier family 31 (copper transporter), member 1 [Entomortierella parvispora]|uniref:Copper transport protein n=1 Tax=Entomortierella parvispora TaxID=205924 RepID=A0A9P3LWE3_9FUNG|nr:solute carrier family 31 (copper transporter), member 1 [Entomortierella parvispora]